MFKNLLFWNTKDCSPVVNLLYLASLLNVFQALKKRGEEILRGIIVVILLICNISPD